MDFNIETVPPGYQLPEYPAVAAPSADDRQALMLADLIARAADAQATTDYRAFTKAKQVARAAMERFRERPSESRRRAAMAASVLARRANERALTSARTAQATADEAARMYEDSGA